MNASNNFDKTDSEYSLAPILMTRLDSGGQRSKVKVTAAVEVTKASTKASSKYSF